MKFDRNSRTENEQTWTWLGASILIVVGLFLSNYFGDVAFLTGLALASIWGSYFVLYLPYKRGGGNALLDFVVKGRDRILLIKGMDLKIGNEVQRTYRISPSESKEIDFLAIFKAMRIIDVTLTFSEIWTEEPYHRLKRLLKKVLETAGLEHRRFIVDYLKSIEDAKASPVNIIFLTGKSANVDKAVNRLKGYLSIEQIPWEPPVSYNVKEGKNPIHIKDGVYPTTGPGNYFKVLIAKELPGGNLQDMIQVLKKAKVNYYIRPDALKTDFALNVLNEDRKSGKKKKGKSAQEENLADYQQGIINALEEGISEGLLILGISVKVIVNASDYDSLNRTVRDLKDNAEIAGFNLVSPKNQATALGDILNQDRGDLEKESIFFLPAKQMEDALSAMYLNPSDKFLLGYPLGYDLAGFPIYLKNMGRCLIAGKSGSGKSVGIAMIVLNTILEKLKRIVVIDHAGSGRTKNSVFLALKRAVEEGYLKVGELTVFDFSDDPKTSSKINIFKVFEDKDTQNEFEKDVFNILSGGLSKGETRTIMRLRKKCHTFSELIEELEKMKDSDIGEHLGYWDEVPWMFGNDEGDMFEMNQYVSYNLWNMSSMRSKIALVNIIVLIEQMRSLKNSCELFLEEAQDLIPIDESLGTPTIKQIITSNFRGGRKYELDVGILVQDPDDLINSGVKDVLSNLNTALLFSNVGANVLKTIGIEKDIDIAKEGKTGVALMWKDRVDSVLMHFGISPLVQNLVLDNLDGFTPPDKELSNRFYRLSDILTERKKDLLAQGHMITTSSELNGMENKFIHHPALDRERAVLTLLVLEQVEKYLEEKAYLYEIETVISGGYIVVSKRGHHILRLYIPEENKNTESILAKIDNWNGRTIAVTKDKEMVVNDAIYPANKIADALPTLLGTESH